MILQWLATATGILMSLGYYPQAWKIFRQKSARDISIPTFAIFSFGTLSWLCYGLYEHDWTIILGFVLGVIGSWTVLALTLWYRRDRGGSPEALP